MDFRHWLETANYGFEKDVEKSAGSTDNTGFPIDTSHPIRRFDIEELFTYLAMRKLGPHAPRAKFISEIYWGEDVGAVRVRAGTGLEIIVEKKAIDLAGEIRWLAKKTYQINREGYGGYEDIVAGEIFEKVEDIYNQPLETPSSEFKLFERLVLAIANKMERVAKEILIFDHITRIDENRYIIVFGVRGHGVEAPDHRRVEQNITEVIFNPAAGTIRVFNTNLESPVGGPHEWAIMPSDQDFYFFPSQERDEITEVIATPMKFY